VVSPLACGADLLRWIRAHWTGGPLVAWAGCLRHRRDDVVLLRMSVLYRGTALPVATPPTPRTRGGLGGCGEPTGRVGRTRTWERMLRWARSALPLDQEAPHAGGSGVVEPPAVAARIRSQRSSDPIMRVRTTSTGSRRTGQARQSVLRLAPGPGHGWVGVGVAFRAAHPSGSRAALAVRVGRRPMRRHRGCC
jgi:hypothetical protein